MVAFGVSGKQAPRSILGHHMRPVKRAAGQNLQRIAVIGLLVPRQLRRGIEPATVGRTDFRVDADTP